MSNHKFIRQTINRKLLIRLFSKIHVSTVNFYKAIPCWEWIAYTNPRGYGEFMFKNKKRSAYKVTYELFVETVPFGLELDHLCRNRMCINPSHLDAVTHRENMARGFHATKANCKHGHKLSGDNLLPTQNGGRQCRTCNTWRKTELRSLPHDHPRRIKERETNKRARLRQTASCR